MRLLVDTHALLWALTGDRKLSKRAHSVLASFDNDVMVSAASVWEICTKFRIGKLPDAEGLFADCAGTIERLGFHALSISVEHAQRAGSLPGPHRDPFDRMLIAQAQAENLPLVSNERIFDSFAITRIW
ncbi:MAG: type II toxin-antitoxin system VapC family toxin [Acidobacteriota bacterium]|nr:type II toxin-antitoxin system VapC family toxin [Acidobacteriota bacterium]